MVTWLHFWIMSMLSMGLAVTDMVTNGYIGYIKKSGYNKSARQGSYSTRSDPFLVIFYSLIQD